MPRKNGIRLSAAVSALLLTTVACNTPKHEPVGGIQTQVACQSEGNGSFTFKNVPAPSRNDAATDAKFTLLSGNRDRSGGGLDKLHDGTLPTEADEPGENFFFAGTEGGRILVDLKRAIDVKEINTYSWHPGSRGPQVYKVYASQGTAADFVAKPEKDADLAKSGWKLVAQVNTQSAAKEIGGQYGVSISDRKGVIGNYRYLLFDIAPGDANDNFGNTFYSEIDVVEKNAPVAPAPAVVATPPFVIKSSDGYCTISIDTSKAPELKQWAEQTLAPVLVEWYPKLVAMMPSEGYSAPNKFSISIRPGDGVAATGGTRIGVNSTWLAKEVNREGVGAIIHEVVHVIQQYNWGGRRNGGNPPPNWLTEGIPDYIRFFKYEPQSHGADMVWLKARPNTALNYDKLYRISANFLDYVVVNYGADKNLVEKMNAACRQGTYTDQMWKDLTGKTLVELNDEWKAAAHTQLAPKVESGDNAEVKKSS